MDNIKRFKVLIVDDTPMNIQVVANVLKTEGYQIAFAQNGKSALDKIRATEFDLILLDVMMPEMDGFQVSAKLKEEGLATKTPIIFLTAKTETESIVKGFEMGAVDYITKPFNSVELLARARTHLELKNSRDVLSEWNNNLQKKVQEQVAQIYSANIGTIFALAKLAESRDSDTGAHLERVREYSKELLIELRKHPKYSDITDDYIKYVYEASPLHDIGKVGIKDSILVKPGKLTYEEFEIMKTHTTIGAETLERVNELYPGNTFVSVGYEIALNHHEKWDGSGYPQGLKEENIPLSGRVVALSDVYDALLSKRCYKPAFSNEDAIKIIVEGKGKHFDPDIVDSFLNIKDKLIDIRKKFPDE
ncbi:MAG: response regulator [Desulfobacterales bacterium]|nr:response regulator [Desulfobacterales bacterium]MBF0396738.1 response regulator [Desulfobacterales bacterium]